MGLGVSIFLIAVGAILTWAVNASVSGLELQTIGVILMVVGALGLVLSIIFWSSWGGFAGERIEFRVVIFFPWSAERRLFEGERVYFDAPTLVAGSST